jgi:hypothetical protein
VIEQQIHGTLDEHRQVSIRHLMTQQILELSQLIVRRLSGGELHFVATGTERCRRAARPRRFQRERTIRLAIRGQCVRRLSHVERRRLARVIQLTL